MLKADKDTTKVLSTNLFPVVGVGASAGGLDAFKRLIKGIPEDSGMAYVLVQHLDPSHESLLPELLQKVTPLPVLEISDDIKVKPDHIYIIPSNKMLVANDGILQLSPRPPKSRTERNLPIDVFFTSLAEVHQNHAIGVVLSGTASDGTLGLKAIKDYGGVTFAQDEVSAAFEGMPQSAVRAGVVDFVLRPEEIGPKILEIKKQLHLDEEDLSNIPQQDEEVYKQMLALVRIRKHTDFTYYKQSTIRRRILRRMAIGKFEEPSSYLAYLKKNKLEQDALFQDFLIPVTAFFRDAKIYEQLCASVFPQIIANKTGDETIRVWIAGCSTGQEAYSMAICLHTLLGKGGGNFQVFATDISEPAILKARSGVYNSSDVAELPAKHLKTYFTKVTGGFRINKQIRDLCIFAHHDFLKDPPFGKIDFISCRNVLIYMEPYLQKKALTTFHYALKPKGFLLLGKSETSASVPDLFTSSDKSGKLFTRKDVPARFIHVNTLRKEYNFQEENMHPNSITLQTDFQKTADEILLSRYTPAGVVINEAMDIVHFRGATSLYLEQAPGKPSHNLLKMAKSGLAFELRNILHKAKKSNEPVEKTSIPLLINGVQHLITMEAIPLLNIVEPHFLILFHENAPGLNPVQDKGNVSGKINSKEKDLYINQLEKEIAQNREDMRSITEDQEAANEELQSSNEELLSGSEELQSLNEELETSREELQSSNEELMVVNQELSSLNEQITRARNYAESIVATIHKPLLILEKDLRVKSANTSFYDSFRITKEATIGFFIYDLGDKQWINSPLRALLEDIIPNSSRFQDYELTHVFPDLGTKIMLLNATRMVQDSHGEQLILLAFNDITEVRTKTLELQKMERELVDRDIMSYKLNKDKLEKEVAERTKALELLNKELHYQNEEKEKRAGELLIANKELESFNYISSHDMQEPLRKIQTYANLIIAQEYAGLSEKGKGYFHRIENAAMLIRQLIADLLDFSSLNKADRNLEKIDLGLIMEEVKNDFKEIIAEKQATFESINLCSCLVIHYQLRQLMQNLIGNSLKFASEKRPPHIVITSTIDAGKVFNVQYDVGPKLLAADKNYCHISLTDNGIGFSPMYKESIFVLFQRLHGKAEYPGTGVGLSIVKKIVENHNGIIVASSAPDEGARFDIFLPA